MEDTLHNESPSSVGISHGDLSVDLLFCLCALEAPMVYEAGPITKRYESLLESLKQARASTGYGWHNSAASIDVQRGSANDAQVLVSSLVSMSWRLQAAAAPTLTSTTATGELQMFLVAAGSWEREQRFRALREEHGSKFAFHGSAPSNWASILRNGLKSLSATGRMAHGAVHGAGVYLSPMPWMAASYSGMAASYSGLTLRKNATGRASGTFTESPPDVEALRCLAVCEVVNMPGTDLQCSGGIWVASNNAMVAVRLLLVFPGNQASKIPDIESLTSDSLMDAARAVSVPPQLRIVPSQIRDNAPRVVQECFPVESVRVADIREIDRHHAFLVDARYYRGASRAAPSSSPGEGVWRRYSEFLELHGRFRVKARHEFPPKHALSSWICGLSTPQLEARRRSLEAWLQELVGVARRGFLREEFYLELLMFLAPAIR